MDKISLQELLALLNQKKAFPIVKKKLNTADLKKVFTDEQLRKVSGLKRYTLYFGIFWSFFHFIQMDFARVIGGMIFIVISFFMKDPNKSFLLEKIKKDESLLISAYNQRLVSFYLYGGRGEITPDAVKIING